MEALEELCKQAKKAPNTNNVYECLRPTFCEHQVTLFDNKRYCRVPLNQDKYLKDGEIVRND